MEIGIHERAAERFNELGEVVLRGVTTHVLSSRPEPPFQPEVHIAAHLTSEDIVGSVKATNIALPFFSRFRCVTGERPLVTDHFLDHGERELTNFQGFSDLPTPCKSFGFLIRAKCQGGHHLS